MKVILKSTNEVKEVSFGYAVNYLIPKGVAVRATDEKIRELENKRIRENETKNRESVENKKLLSKFTGKKINLKVKAGKKGKLHGAITKKEIAKKLGVGKEVIELEEPIKKVGRYQIGLKFGTARGIINLNVTAAKNEAK